MTTSSLDLYPRVGDLAFAFGGPKKASAIFKAEPADFFVEEIMGFDLSGEGEHLWLFLECTDMNTDFTVKQLARAFGIEKRAVSYSGKKDRRAVTRQWFSLHMPGQRADVPDSIHPNIKVVEAKKHHKKLRRGTHKSNLFQIKLRQCQNLDQVRLDDQINQINQLGYPNYFGPQRFGFQENNIDYACQMMASGKRLKRVERDRVFSTLRAWDFNRFLNTRILESTWQSYLPGDLMLLVGSSSFFQPELWDEELQQRLDSGDIQLAGLLPGKGELSTPTKMGEYLPDASLTEYLVKQKVEQGVRPLAIKPKNFTANVQNDQIELSFILPKGAYATSLLRELVNLQEPAT